jgi:hypothetical protein
MPATQRKIFPHLDKEKSSTDSNDNKKPEDSKNYDNAKSSKKHPSARNNAANKNGKINTNGVKSVGKEAEAAPTHHLLPMPLVLLVLLCSGFYWISSFRDMMATGKPMLDSLGSMLRGQSEDDINLLVRQHNTAYICIDTHL